MGTVRRSAGFAAVLIILLAFLDGPLFPWSPVTPGYQHLALARGDVIYPSDTSLDASYGQLDHYVAETEAFHRLKMPKRVRIIVLRDWTDLLLQSAFRSRSHGLGAATLPTGTVIWVTPKLRERNLEAAPYLRHELSHAILHQNASLLESLRIADVRWFSEGLAHASGQTLGCPVPPPLACQLTRDEFVARVRAAPLWPAFDGRETDMRVNYAAWRYFVEYMMRMRDRDVFQAYLLGFIKNPDDAGPLFQRTFGIALPDAVIEFERQVRSGKAP
jgi:hypothetical protein